MKRKTFGGKLILMIPVFLIILALTSSCAEENSKPTGDVNAFCRNMSARLLELEKKSAAWFLLDNGCILTPNAQTLRGRIPPANPVQVITCGNPKLKRVAITIDDGWNADARILKLLKSKGVPFTAFIIGGRGVAENNPEFIREIKDAGGEVCSHTYSHYVMRGKDKAFVLNEIWKAQEIITSITHELYPYVRFSGGAYDEASLQWTGEEGFWIVNWTAASGDTDANATPESEVNNILSRLRPGAILLFHFGGHHTYEALSRLIPEIRARGFEPTSLTHVLEGTEFMLSNETFSRKGSRETSIEKPF
ncbi:MAG: polysaccharide deacetylase family protein [Actinomycetota bacterium]|nr:polysaccharide deacetylase family protein [Actinomycetota bacterium]